MKLKMLAAVLVIGALLGLATGCDMVIDLIRPKPPDTGKCVINLANGHRYCLTPEDRFMSWAEAEDHAVRLGGNLVAITDQDEQDWLVQHFGGYTWMWIGFTDSAREGVWVWSNGDPVTYTNWYFYTEAGWGEPNDSHCGEDYAVMNWISPGYWNDLGPCSPEWESVGIGIMELPGD